MPQWPRGCAGTPSPLQGEGRGEGPRLQRARLRPRTQPSPPKGKRLATPGFTVILWLGFVGIATAQSPGLELVLETQTLELGEAIRAQLVCTNTGVPGTPQVAISDGLDIKLLNPTPATSSFTQIINGRTTQRTTYTYTLQVTALKAGSHALGPFSVEADGTTYQSRASVVVVRATDDSALSRGERFLFAEIEVEPRSLFVTESYLATLTMGIRKVEIGGRVFEIDVLRKVLDQGSCQFSVFSDGSVKRTEQWLTSSEGVRHPYEVFRVTKQVRAEQVGEDRIGPVFLKANYPTKVRRGFFGDYEISETRRETARVDAVSVVVKAPPEAGRPPDYNGAIGQFSLNVSAKPNRVTLGQPLTLTVSVSGAPLEGVAGPDLAAQAELASRFDYTKDELAGDVEDGSKVFRRAIFPKQIGVQTVPPISWSFFHPREARYVTLTSEPISISVDPTPANGTTVTAFHEVAAVPHWGTALTVLQGGLSPNFADANEVLASQSVGLTPAWLASLVLWPPAWLLVTLAVRRRNQLRADVNFARRQRARRRAEARIRVALNNGDPAVVWPALAASVTGYVSDRFSLPPETLTPAEVRSVLQMHGVERTTSQEIGEFLESCEAVRFAREAAGMDSSSQAAAKVSEWIRRIERSKH